MGETEITQNETKTDQVPEYIVNAIKNHVVLGYENAQKILVIDLEGEEWEKEMFEKIASKVSVVLRDDMENYMGKISISDIVDIVKLYPLKKVFIITTLKHIQRHNIIDIAEWIKTNKEVIKYETGLVAPSWHHYLAVDYTKPFTYGLSIYTISLQIDEIEDIAKLVLGEIMNYHNAVLNNIENTGGDYRYTIFQKLWYIYNNTPQLKFIKERFTDSEDTIERLDNNYAFTKNKWLMLIEFNSKFIRDFLDP